MWEEEQYGQLISLLNSTRWKRGSVDRRIWGVGDLKTYTVDSGYRVLNEIVALQVVSGLGNCGALK